MPESIRTTGGTQMQVLGVSIKLALTTLTLVSLNHHLTPFNCPSPRISCQFIYMAEHVGEWGGGSRVWGLFACYSFSYLTDIHTDFLPSGTCTPHDCLLKIDTMIDSMKECGLSFPFTTHWYILSGQPKASRASSAQYTFASLKFWFWIWVALIQISKEFQIGVGWRGWLPKVGHEPA